MYALKGLDFMAAYVMAVFSIALGYTFLFAFFPYASAFCFAIFSVSVPSSVSVLCVAVDNCTHGGRNILHFAAAWMP